MKTCVTVWVVLPSVVLVGLIALFIHDENLGFRVVMGSAFASVAVGFLVLGMQSKDRGWRVAGVVIAVLLSMITLNIWGLL